MVLRNTYKNKMMKDFVLKVNQKERQRTAIADQEKHHYNMRKSMHHHSYFQIQILPQERTNHIQHTAGMSYFSIPRAFVIFTAGT